VLQLSDVRSLLPTHSDTSQKRFHDENEKELHQLAEEEAKTLSTRLQMLEQEMLLSLLPSAQDEDRNAILEVHDSGSGVPVLCLELIFCL